MPRSAIVTTVDRPDLGPIAAGWIWQAFWRKKGTPLAEIEALVAASKACVGPPQCLVALADGVPVGTASLIRHDLDERPDLTPWLAALYVDPPARGKGHARDLIRAVEEAAAQAGIPELWLYTSTAEGLYASVGWQAAERFARGPTVSVIMRRTLA